MKSAVVIGSTGGIGQKVALELANCGYDVVCHTHSKRDAAEELAKRIGGTAVLADIADEAQVRALFEKLPKLDVLVNCAGIAEQALFTQISEAQWNRMFEINVKGVFLCCREAAKIMLKNHSGSIVNISSMWGITGAACEVHYSAAKAAVIGLTKALAKELAPSGITVNCVAPGFIDTPMNSHLSKDEVEAFRREIPLERIGTAKSVAKAVAYLAAADYVTGQVLAVDGGITI